MAERTNHRLVRHLLGANTVTSCGRATSDAVPDCSTLEIYATLRVDLIHEGRNVLPCVRFARYVKLTVLELLRQKMGTVASAWARRQSRALSAPN